MFSSLRQRLILGIYIFVILSIPLGAYFLSQSPTSTPKKEEKQTIQKKPVTSAPSPSPKPTSTPKPKSPLDLLEDDILDEPSPQPQASPTTATSYGPTLSLKVKLEGRPDNNQTSRLFVGIVEGQISNKPTFLLSFTINLSQSGEFSNLSLAGLTSGTTYTALLKSPAQIATSSAFVMTPTVSNLNSGQAILLLSGDLNEDNTVNSADYSVARAAYGTSSGSNKWNDNVDFNKDGKINSLDLAFIIKNFGKIGSSGAWTSSPLTATSSGGLTPQGSSGDESASGYWIWVPR